MPKVFHFAKTGNRTWNVSGTQGMTKRAGQEIRHDLAEYIEMQDIEWLSWSWRYLFICNCRFGLIVMKYR